ncbi:cadherin-6-like, partial [Clarias magur]
MRTLTAFLLWVWAAHCVDAMALLRGKDASWRERNTEVLKRSKRGWMWKQFFLQEEYTGTDYQYIGKLHSDMDRGDGTVMYVLTGEGAGTIFVIDPESGDLHATRSLDREEKPSYTLRAQAVNKKNGHPLEPETEFIVKLHDINDNEPKFEKEVYMATVPERSHIGTSVIQVTAHDADDEMFGLSAKLVYSISQGHPYFSVESNTGIIRTALGPSDMDREQREHYQVVIEAKDMAGQRGGLTGSTIVNITLTDVNDNPPQFEHSVYEFSVPELSEPGTEVGQVRALDADIGLNAEMDYTLVGGDGRDVFYITADKASQNGIISVRKPLDYEKKNQYTLQVQVRNTYPDPRYVSVDAKDMTTVRINVVDVDEPPRFERPSYVMEVKEDAALGTVIGSVSAADQDARRSPVKYTIDRHTDVDRMFNVHAGNGSIFLQKPLDREDLAWHNISVIATEFNNPQQASRVPVYIRVLDVNDNPPTLGSFLDTFVCENAKSGQKIQTITAVDRDEPLEGHSFSFALAPESSMKANFSVQDYGDNTAGLYTRRTGFRRMQQSTYLVSVMISDHGFPVMSSTGTLTVRVCTCDRNGNMEMCNAEALSGTAGLSTGALVAILLCVIILL